MYKGKWGRVGGQTFEKKKERMMGKICENTSMKKKWNKGGRSEGKRSEQEEVG